MALINGLSLMNVYGLETIQIIQVLNNDIEDEACSYGNFRVQSV